MAGKYTGDQIKAYHDRIGVPKDAQKTDVTALEPKASLDYLKSLMKAHLLTVPFENLVSALASLSQTPPTYDLNACANRRFTTPRTVA